MPRFEPLGGIKCSLNIPAHPIVNKAPLDQNGKKPQLPIITFQAIFQIQLDFLFAHCPETRVQRNASNKLNGSSSNYTYRAVRRAFFLCGNSACLKEDNNKSLTQGPQEVLTKCYSNMRQEQFKTRTKKRLKIA